MKFIASICFLFIYYITYNMKSIKDGNSNDTKNFYVLKKSTSNIDQIIHISDLHVKNKIELHENYEIILSRLYKSIYEKIDMEKKNIIVITGDIFDDHEPISPQNLLVKKMFIALASICPVFYILGNHDLSYYGKPETNLISITDNLDTLHKIYFLNENAVYEYHNLLICVTDQYAKKLTSYNKKTDKILISLYHGSLKNDFFKRNDVDTNNFTFSVEDFENLYDWSLCGDWHERTLHPTSKKSEKRTVMHAGSLWQTCKSESYIKGYILISLTHEKATFVDIKNDKCTINIKKDNEISNIPKNYKNLEINFGRSVSKKEIEKVKKMMDKKGIDVTINIDEKWNNKYINLSVMINDEELDYKNLSLEQQQKFLYNSIIDNENLDDDELDIIWKIICKKVNDNYREYDDKKKIKFNRLQMNNFGSYGDKDNVIYFDNKDGKIISILSKNGNGKTTIYHSIVYVLYGSSFFDKSIEEFKNVKSESKIIGSRNSVDLINSNNDKMWVKLNFSVDDDEYEITRFSTRRKDGKSDDRSELKKNGKIYIAKNIPYNREKIDDFMLSIFNNVNMFVMKSMSLKNSYSVEFSDLSSAKKMEYLNNMFSLTILNDITNSVCSDKNKSRSLEYDNEKKKFLKYECTLNDNYNKIYKTCSIELNSLLEKERNCEGKKEKIVSSILKIEKKKTEIITEMKLLGEKSGIKYTDDEFDEKIQKFEEEKKKIKNDNDNIKKKINALLDNNEDIEYSKQEKKIETLEKKIKKLKDEIKKNTVDYTKKNYSVAKNENDIKKNENIKKNTELNKNKSLLKKLNDKTDDKENLIYDNEIYNYLVCLLKKTEKICKCKKMIDYIKFEIEKYEKIKDDECVYEKIKKVEKKINILETEIKNNKEIINKNNLILNTERKFNTYNNKKNEYDKLLININDIKKKISEYENNCREIEKNGFNVKNNKCEIEKINTYICKIEDIQQEMEKNRKNRKRYNVLKNERETIENEEEELNDEKKTIDKKIKNIGEKIKELDTNLKELKGKIDLNNETKKMFNIYSLIEKKIKHKNGIYDKLLKKNALPRIEKMLNELLKLFELYEVKILLKDDGLHIVKKNDDVPLKKFSSAEKNLFNLIFRIILVSVSNKTSTPYFIDEVFDNFDVDRQKDVKILLNEMKKYFSFIMVVSHNEKIKKIGDINFTIVKDKYSHLRE